jgi:hypothetical protein
MQGEISFDIIIGDDAEHPVFEGCYRITPGDWVVFCVTKWWGGASQAGVNKGAVFSSGVKGVNINYPKDKVLNKNSVKEVLAESLSIADWVEVKGPDSLMIK